MVVDIRPPRRRGDAADAVFHALADPTRRDILEVTLRAPHSVSALARRYPMSFAAVQKHVTVLERARLVTKERRGREQLVRGNPDTLRRAARLLDELESVWRARVDRIGEILAEPREHSAHGLPAERDVPPTPDRGATP